MKTHHHPLARTLGLAAICFASAVSADAQVVFTDDFNSGASPQWGNQSGNWSAAGGVYSALSPSSPDYSGLPFSLTDFAVDVDINDVGDGGIWLRSDASGQNGILLTTSGDGWGIGVTTGGRALYWHVVQNGNPGQILNYVSAGWTPGVSDVHIRATVVGNTYSCFLNGSATPITTLTDSHFSSGLTGLYDFSSQTFDNYALTVVPEPSTLALLGLGTVGWWLGRRAKRRDA